MVDAVYLFAWRCLDKEKKCELIQRALILIHIALAIHIYMIDVL
jgi:hypothetical protein